MMLHADRPSSVVVCGVITDAGPFRCYWLPPREEVARICRVFLSCWGELWLVFVGDAFNQAKTTRRAVHVSHPSLGPPARR